MAAVKQTTSPADPLTSVWLKSGGAAEAVSVTDTNSEKYKKYLRAIYVQDTSTPSTNFTADVVVTKVDQATSKEITIARFNFSAINSTTGSKIWLDGQRHLVNPGDAIKLTGNAGDTHAGYLVRLEYSLEN